MPRSVRLFSIPWSVNPDLIACTKRVIAAVYTQFNVRNDHSNPLLAFGAPFARLSLSRHSR